MRTTKFWQKRRVARCFKFYVLKITIIFWVSPYTYTLSSERTLQIPPHYPAIENGSPMTGYWMGGAVSESSIAGRSIHYYIIILQWFKIHGVLHAKVSKMTNKKRRNRGRYSIFRTYPVEKSIIRSRIPIIL